MPGQIVICLCVYYFIYEFNQLFNAYKGCRRDLAQRPVPDTDNGRE